MKIGYARVSTLDQNPDGQQLALEAAGCERIAVEHVSGAATKRPQLDKLLSGIEAGDILAVYRLDRLGRSLPHLLDIARALESKGAHLQSLSEAIDTTTAGGRLIFHVMGALAEFERALIVERTTAGLEAAKKRGARIGRPKGLTAAQIDHARKLIEGGERVQDIARTFEVSRATLYRALKR